MLSRRSILLGAALAALLTPLSSATSSAAGRCGAHPWCDTTRSADERAGLLLGALTRDEKISLLAGDELTGVSGREGSHTGTSNGVDRVGLPPVFSPHRGYGYLGVPPGSAPALLVGPFADAPTFCATLRPLPPYVPPRPTPVLGVLPQAVCTPRAPWSTLWPSMRRML